MNYKTSSGTYEILYPRTTTGNITDFSSVMRNYYTKGESDGRYATTSWVQNNYYTKTQTNSQINSTIQSEISDFEDNVVEPIGTIKCTSRTDLGNDWLLCNGQSFSSSDYPGLASLLPASATSAWQLVGSDKCPVSGDVIEANNKYFRFSINSNNNVLTIYYTSNYGLNASWSNVTVDFPTEINCNYPLDGIYFVYDIAYNSNSRRYYILFVQENYSGDEYYRSGIFMYSTNLTSWTTVKQTTVNTGQYYSSELFRYGADMILRGVSDQSNQGHCLKYVRGYNCAFFVDESIFYIYSNDTIVNSNTGGTHWLGSTDDCAYGYRESGQNGLLYYHYNQNAYAVSGEGLQIKSNYGSATYTPFGFFVDNKPVFAVMDRNTGSPTTFSAISATLGSTTPVLEQVNCRVNWHQLLTFGGKDWFIYNNKISYKTNFLSGQKVVSSSTTANQLIVVNNTLYAINNNDLYVQPGGVVPNISSGSNYKYYIKGR